MLLLAEQHSEYRFYLFTFLFRQENLIEIQSVLEKILTKILCGIFYVIA